MNRALSVRVDESVLRCLAAVARKLGIAQKDVIERAIEMYAEEAEHGLDPLVDSHGAWQRNEAPSETVEQARQVFRGNRQG